MVFTEFLQKIGLLDVLAPNSPSKRKKRKAKNDEKEAAETEKLRVIAEKQRRLVADEERLETQYQTEKAAAERNQFAKKQRVIYNASDEQRYDAVIMGVHFDDDPKFPYYTIKYKRFEESIDSEESSKPAKKNIIEVEKQTNPERLTSVLWDKEKTRKILIP
mmetsp:Transcript_2922/g.3219  ORF Transcript_2922/g.3219 Transcript_2922/m.3219 type:complete len:162 (-) Transcript_2922:300-785(-)